MNKKKVNTDSQGLTARIPEIRINPRNPFQNDKLHRKEDIKILTRIVNTFEGGAVISVNGVWGSGKSIFLKLWKQFLSNKHYPVIYYNAWEDDICEEPLFSMIKCLKSISKTESCFDTLVEKTGKFFAGAHFSAVKSMTGYWGKVIGDGIKGGIEQVEKDCIASLNNKDTTTTLLNEFKEALSDFVADIATKGYKVPLVYFVDELDRCNPTFAVKVLERIKHLFEVDNVVFILAIDNEQFCHSINGYFGSDAFDSVEYLKRFIDIEYTIQATMSDDYCLRLFKHFRLDKTMNKKTAKDFVSFTNTCCDAFGLSCRQIEKVFSLYTVAYYCIDNKLSSRLKKDLLFYLAAIKVRDPNLFNDIQKCRLTVIDLIKRIEKLYLDWNSKRIELWNHCFADVFSWLISLYIDFHNETNYLQLNDNRTNSIDDETQFVFELFYESSMMDAIRNHQKTASEEQLDYYLEKLRMVNSFERKPELSEEEIARQIKETLNRLKPMYKNDSST